MVSRARGRGVYACSEHFYSLILVIIGIYPKLDAFFRCFSRYLQQLCYFWHLSNEAKVMGLKDKFLRR
jgi:hypothetical protein